MPRTIGVIRTPYIGIEVRGRSLGIQMRPYLRNQIHPQHVLLSLRQRHVEFGIFPVGCIRLTLINPLFLVRLLLDP